MESDISLVSMKLINKISRYFLYLFIFISIGMFLSIYFITQTAITDEADEQLTKIRDEAIKELKENRAVNFPPFIEIEESNDRSVRDIFGDSSFLLRGANEEEPYRTLFSIVNVNGRFYQIIVRTSLEEKEEMLYFVTSVAGIAILLFMILFTFFNRAASKKILKDFHTTLQKLNEFSIDQKEKFVLEKANIEEFNNLNKSLEYLADKAINEYRSLKEFTEELNHEIQTPLAVIKSKLELMLQTENLDKDSYSILDISLKQLSKINRINKSILFLNKLEHKKLFESESVELTGEINNALFSLNDYIIAKNISINKKIDRSLFLWINQSLLNILIVNLFSNSIRHNINNGTIEIELIGNVLTISNNGKEPVANPEKFFERFYKESELNESIGLGLTIVKKICDNYGINIKYIYDSGFHKISLDFNNSITES